EVDIGHLLPDRRRIGNLRLPVRSGEVRVERCLKIAGNAPEARAVGHEAVGDQVGLGPLVSRGCIKQEPSFQFLQAGTDGFRPWCAMKETTPYSITSHGELLPTDPWKRMGTENDHSTIISGSPYLPRQCGCCSAMSLIGPVSPPDLLRKVTVVTTRFGRARRAAHASVARLRRRDLERRRFVLHF